MGFIVEKGERREKERKTDGFSPSLVPRYDGLKSKRSKAHLHGSDSCLKTPFFLE